MRAHAHIRFITYESFSWFSAAILKTSREHRFVCCNSRETSRFVGRRSSWLTDIPHCALSSDNMMFANNKMTTRECHSARMLLGHWPLLTNTSSYESRCDSLWSCCSRTRVYGVNTQFEMDMYLSRGTTASIRYSF